MPALQHIRRHYSRTRMNVLLVTSSSRKKEKRGVRWWFASFCSIISLAMNTPAKRFGCLIAAHVYQSSAIGNSPKKDAEVHG